MRRYTLLVLAVLSVFVFASCTQAPAEEEKDITINITLNEFQVVADRTDIPDGATVTFNITNEGVLTHELVLEIFNAVDAPLEFTDGSPVELEDIEPGQTVTLEYTFGEGGAFQLACHVPGHYEAGMFTGISVGGTDLPEHVIAPAGEEQEGEVYAGNGECPVRAVDLIGAWVDASAPNGTFEFTDEDGAACEGDFEADILPLFTEEGAWFPGSESCTKCHFEASEDSFHEMDMTNYDRILAGADTLEDPPGASILGESSPGAGDFNWGESELRARLRDNRMPPGWTFDITEENRDGPTLSIGGMDVRAVDLIGDWVDAGAPESDAFGDYGATFETDILPLFTTEGIWYEGSEACIKCHFEASEDSYHEMDLSNYLGILSGADTLEDPPGASILGESTPGAGDFNWDESELRIRLRNNRMPPGIAFDITEENRDGPTIQAGTHKAESALPRVFGGLVFGLTGLVGMVVVRKKR